MKTVADTSVLIALLNSGDRHNETASELLGKANRKGGVFMNPVVYSELAAFMESKEKLESFLEETGLKMESIEREAAFLASQKFSDYLNNRGEKLKCPGCGEENRIECESCGRSISKRQHIASDFLIGAHAQKQADRLLSFDQDFYSTYFRQLEVKSSRS